MVVITAASIPGSHYGIQDLVYVEIPSIGSTWRLPKYNCFGVLTDIMNIYQKKSNDVIKARKKMMCT